MRKDLSLAQQLVQSAHACIEAALKFSPEVNCTLIVLQVRNIKQLWKAVEMLESKKIRSHMFWEPDCAQFTAVATEMLPEDTRFEDYDLWRPSWSDLSPKEY